MHGPTLAALSSPVGIAGEMAVQIAAFLAVLLFASAIHKLVERARSRHAARSLAGLGARAAGIAVAGIVAAEAIAGVALLIPAARSAGALLAAGIWGGYFLMLMRMVVSGRHDVDCGCSFGSTPHALGATALLRTGGLALAALLTAAATAGTHGARGADFAIGRVATSACAALALLALYLAFDQIGGLRPRLHGAMR